MSVLAIFSFLNAAMEPSMKAFTKFQVSPLICGALIHGDDVLSADIRVQPQINPQTCLPWTSRS